VNFAIIGEIAGTETFARGLGVHIRDYLNHTYAAGQPVRWRKRKGFATVAYDNGEVYYAEVHWFEGHGIGKVKMTVKRRIRRIA
jgi:hypothetical protein